MTAAADTDPDASGRAPRPRSRFVAVHVDRISRCPLPHSARLLAFAKALQ